MRWQYDARAGNLSAVSATEGPDIDSTLAEVIAALNRSGFWAKAFDTEWRTVALTDELAAVHGDDVIFGVFMFGPDQQDRFLQGRSGGNSLEENQNQLRRVGEWILADMHIGRDELRAMLHPDLREFVDEIEPTHATANGYVTTTSYLGRTFGVAGYFQRVRDSEGQVVGTVLINKPAVGMTTMSIMTMTGDLEHFNRMIQLGEARRRAAAVLFADIEGSTALSKRLPTESYFTFVRRIMRAADQAVIDAGGLVGRHVGDGVTAFFVAETAGSEPSAARGCIGAARALQAAVVKVADRHGLGADGVTLRAGLHWAATPFIGSIITSGRSEVTALGDDVNNAARIEACATGGRILASKELIERLDPVDAAALGIDLSGVSYTQLADLDTVTDKARRDAPAIAVCDLNAAG
jgi:class 3 adenylate cyclase